MKDDTKNSIERRSEHRRPLNEALQLRVINEKLEVTAHCCNLSSSGMLVQVNEHIKVGSLLSISLPNDEIGFDADGEVIRVVKDEKQYLMAIKLSNIKQ